jgi:ADP-ribosylglycohydrolase
MKFNSTTPLRNYAGLVSMARSCHPIRHTAQCRDVREMRVRFDSVYSGRGIPYAQSYANEVVTKAVCVFRMVNGVAWEAMKAAVNMGRDTDCLAAVAGGG